MYKLPEPNFHAFAIVDMDYVEIAKRFNCEVAAIKAVAKTESSSGGFLGSGRPKILFEGHIFYKLTNGVHAKEHPSICYPKWTTKYYKGGEDEYKRLEEALVLNSDAALKSASWGRFQIMGFNFASCKEPYIETFVENNYKGENFQLTHFANFCEKIGVVSALQKKDWRAFAKSYNGPAYAKNLYHVKMKSNYDYYKKDFGFIPK